LGFLASTQPTRSAIALKKYKLKPNPEKRSHWDSKFLPKVLKIKDKKGIPPDNLSYGMNENPITL
jgi:hypothetical protein